MTELTTYADFEQVETIHSQEQIDAVREQIHVRQIEGIAKQKEVLVQSPELRQTIRDVAALREVSVDTEYDDFDGLFLSMRGAFDFRTRPDGSYGERVEAEENAKEFLEKCDDGQAARIYEVAEGFGLTGNTEPIAPDVKAAIILGGAAKSPLNRTMYAKELMDVGKLVPEYLVALGSDRPVSAAEIKRAGEFAEGAKTEYDLMVKAAEQVFDSKIDSQDILEWQDQQISVAVPNKVRIAYIPATDKYPPMFIISSAVITDPNMDVLVDDIKKTILRNRANSEDTFATMGRMAGLEPGDKAVAITNAHFRPFQGAAAAGQLGEYGIDTEVVGFDPKHFDNAPKRPDELLQEMLTTADSLSKADGVLDKDSAVKKRRIASARPAGTTAVADSVKEREGSA